jgi:hypothetical protein
MQESSTRPLVLGVLLARLRLNFAEFRLAGLARVAMRDSETGFQESLRSKRSDQLL